MTILQYMWNFGKYQHRIGYWYQLLRELQYWLISKISYQCITTSGVPCHVLWDPYPMVPVFSPAAAGPNCPGSLE